MSESNKVSNPDNSIHINLVPIDPNAVADLDKDQIHIYALKDPITRQMIDLQLHKVDLAFVEKCLELLTHRHVTLTVESEAIWTAALVRFFKCFSSADKGRSKLSEKKIFKSEPSEAMVSYFRLKTLRDKTVVHDQNSWMQGKLGVPIAFPPNANPRMGPITFIVFAATTLDDENVSNLTLLTKCALKWIEEDYIKKEGLLLEKLKKEKAATIVANGVLIWTAPSHETANQTKSQY